MVRPSTLLRLTFSILLLITLSACDIETPESAVREDGTEIFFDVRGSGDPALVFIHGWCNDKGVRRNQLDHFSADHTVVAIDLPGSGRSVSNRKEWTISAFAHDVRAVMDILDLDDVVLVGFSMGAFVAVEAAAENPEGIRGLVLADEIRDLDVQFAPEQVAFMDSLFRDLVYNPTHDKLLSNGFYREGTGSALAHVKQMMGNISLPTWEKSLPHIFDWLGSDCSDRLRQTDLPVRSIVSDFRPTNVEAMGKYLEDFEYEIIPNTSHLIMWDAPDTFNSWLKAVIDTFPEE